MLGFGSKKDDTTTLPLYVQTVASPQMFGLATKLWQINAQHVRHDSGTGKEFLRFSLISPAQVVWLERDINRQDAFEMILKWDASQQRYADVFVIVNSTGGSYNAELSHVGQLLNGLLTTPSTLPAEAT